jgi:aspartate aminotransferase-like enzyme
VEVLLGSGSLANDAISGQLSLLKKRGLVLSNGEFGERLVDHATRQGLQFDVYDVDWGEPFDYEEVRRRIEAGDGIGWLWVTHCETSTGILNDLSSLKALCSELGVKLCLDCISSIGTVLVDLSGVYLASCVSGKALASYPGLSMVFYNHQLQPAPRSLPRYLDLGYYASQSGIPFTQSSNLVFALQTALHRICWQEKFDQIGEANCWLRKRLRDGGLNILAPDDHASPAVVTIILPPEIKSSDVGKQLRGAGYLLSYNSAYLLRRNWIQICLMGEWSMENLEILAGLLAASCGTRGERPVEPVLQPIMS